MAILSIALAGAVAGLLLALLARRHRGVTAGLIRLAAICVAIGAQVLALVTAGPAAGPIVVMVVAALGYWWYLNEISAASSGR